MPKVSSIALTIALCQSGFFLCTVQAQIRIHAGGAAYTCLLYTSLSEIQKAARSSAQGDALGGTDFPARSKAVGALADGCAARFPGGSRMS